MASESELPPPYSPSPYPNQPRLPGPSGYRSPLQGSSRPPSQSYRSPQPPNQQPLPPLFRTHVPSRTNSGSRRPSPISRANSGAGAPNESTREDPARATRRRIAKETVAAMAEGIYSARGISFNLRRRVREMTEGVRYYAPQERIPLPHTRGQVETHVEVVNSTTLDAARRFEKMYRRDAAAQAAREGEKVILSPGASGEEERWDWGIEKEKPSAGGRQFSSSATKTKGSRMHLPRIGILSSASPFEPAGNFLAGDDGQELSIARASTLVAALETRTARPFYHTAANENGKGNRKASAESAYHTHAMVYAPGVSVIRDEQGEWTPPMAVDVITCTAVHAGDARAAASLASPSPASPSSLASPASLRLNALEIEQQIERVTAERLSRVLAVFASHSVRTLVLPAFGAGTFQNDVGSVARIYAALLLGPKAPFAGVFERVVFSIMPENKYREFRHAFWGAVPRRRERNEGALGMRGQGRLDSDARSIVSIQGGQATVAPSVEQRAPRQLGDGASVRDLRLSLSMANHLNLGDDQDGRATTVSRRDNRSASDVRASSSGGVTSWRSNVDEGQDGAELEYVIKKRMAV